MGKPIETEFELSDKESLIIGMTILKGRMDAVETTVAKHHKILLEGNGELPIVEKVRNHQDYIASTKYWMRVLALAAVAQAVTLISSVVIYMVKIYPTLETVRVLGGK